MPDTPAAAYTSTVSGVALVAGSTQLPISPLAWLAGLSLSTATEGVEVSMRMSVLLAFGSDLAVDVPAVGAADPGAGGGVAADRVVALRGLGDLGAVTREGLAARGKPRPGAGDRRDPGEVAGLAGVDGVGLGGVGGPVAGVAAPVDRDGGDLVVDLEGRGRVAGVAAADDVAGVLRLRGGRVGAARETVEAQAARAGAVAGRAAGGCSTGGGGEIARAGVVPGREGAHVVAARERPCRRGRRW